MFDIIKSVIQAGGYRLADIQRKIKKMYATGDLTEAEMEQLLALAFRGVTTDAERPEMLQMIQVLADKVAALDERVKVLEGKPADPEGDYPAWKPWDGISKDYQPGAVVSYGGKLWQSVYAGQNVWEPCVTGEQLWVEYKEA